MKLFKRLCVAVGVAEAREAVEVEAEHDLELRYADSLRRLRTATSDIKKNNHSVPPPCHNDDQSTGKDTDR